MCCSQCQGWRMRTSTSSTDYWVTFVSVEHRIVLAFVRVPAFCTKIFCRLSRFVKPEEDIWISGFTSCRNTGLQISVYYMFIEYFVPQNQPGDGKSSALCGALFQLSWGVLIPFPAAPVWSHTILMGTVCTAEDSPFSEILLAPQDQHSVRLTIHLIYTTASLSDGKLSRHLSHQWVWDHI